MISSAVSLLNRVQGRRSGGVTAGWEPEPVLKLNFDLKAEDDSDDLMDAEK